MEMKTAELLKLKKNIYIYPYGLGLRKRSLKHSTKSDNH